MSLQRVVRPSSLLLGVFLCQILVQSAVGQVRPRVSEAVDDARRTTLSGNIHPLARAEFDRGAVAESQPMNRILLLLRRSDEQEAALQDALAKQQDKSSASFHQWLTPEQFGAQFGSADADIQAVTDWLTRQGFTIGKIYSGKTVIEFSGTAGQVQRAFGTAIHNYQVNGKTYSANASDPQIPAALAPVITGVVSLHNFPREFYARRFGTMRKGAGKSIVDPLVTMPSPFGPGSFYGVGPGDFAKIYGVPATCGSPAVACTGSGQTIAIVGETNLLVTDVQQFRSVFGLPATFDANSIVYNGEDPGITSTDEEAEADLDTQWSGGVAPGATVKYVLSASTSASQGVDLSALYIVEHNLAAVMSESYGACESSLGSAGNSFYNNLWQQASAQGITVAVSTGDSGSAGCDDPHQEGLATHSPAVSGLASTPYNVAVGGTDFDEFGNWTKYWSSTNDTVTGASALGYIPEIPWNQSCAQLGATGCNINTTPVQLQNIVAGGGGPSGTYTKPSWQVGVAGMPTDNHRNLPDISLLASPGFNGTGYLYCQSDTFNSCSASAGFSGSLRFGVIGGTSASAPAFAGIMALINQSQATAQNPAPRQGNANYVLYALANKSGASCVSATPVGAGCVFNDVTNGSSALPTGGTGMGTISVPCRGVVIGCSATLTSQIGVLDDPNIPSRLAWNAGAGYDRATGLGSLNVSNLATGWASTSSVPTTTALTLSPQTGIAHGSNEDVSVNISVTPKSGTAAGTVSLLAQPSAGMTVSVGEFTLGANGSASGTTTNLPGGMNYAVYAHYSGDGTNAPSDSTSTTVSVTPESSKVFIVVPTFDPNTGGQIGGNATSVNYGSRYIVRVYVTNSTGVATTTGAPTGACGQSNKVACPSGTIALTANGNGVDGGTFNLNDIGYTRDIVPTLLGGTYPLAAAYSGDSSYQPSSGSETFTVNPAATTLSAPTTGLNTIQIGNQTTYFATTLFSQAFTGVAPTGTVTFYDGATALTDPVTLFPSAPNGSGPGSLQAQITTAFSTPGNHTITAKYSGDGNYAAATSAGSNTVDAVYPTLISLNVSPSTITFGQNVLLTAIVTSLGKNPQMTGQVQFTGLGNGYTNVTTTPGTDGSGNQTLVVTATTVPQGSGPFFATYQGDTNFAFASANPAFVNVNIPDFTMGPQAGAGVVPPAGQAGSTAITITPMTQTPSSVSMSLFPGVAIAGYTVAITPQQANLNGVPATVMVSLTPNGAAPTGAIQKQVRRAGVFGIARGGWWTMSLSVGIGVALLAGFPGRRKRLRAALGLGLVCVVCFGPGCGGGGGSTGGGSPIQNTTSVTLTTSNSKAGQNDPWTITATVSGGQIISGTLTFYDYGVPYGSPFVVTTAQPQAQLVTGNLFLGIHQLTAKYSGNAKNLPSNSPSITQTITGSVTTTIQGQTGTVIHSVPVTIGLQ